MSKQVLLVVTSHARLGDTGQPTGFWLEELAAPYYEFLDAGLDVQLASPLGGRPPADPKSTADATGAAARFLADAAAMARLERTQRIADVSQLPDAIFVVGGHGVMWDLAQDAALATLIRRVWEAGRPVAAVCHGPAALVPVTLSDGTPLVRGRKLAAFTNEEEDAVQLTGVVPFALQSKLEQLGATHIGAPKFTPHAVRDGLLITGQNPPSSVLVAQQTLEALR